MTHPKQEELRTIDGEEVITGWSNTLANVVTTCSKNRKFWYHYVVPYVTIGWVDLHISM